VVHVWIPLRKHLLSPYSLTHVHVYAYCSCR
jgi:hypothetical protein